MVARGQRRHAARNLLVRGAWQWASRAGEIRAGTRAARRFAAFGEGASIAFPYGTLFGEPWVEIGAHTLIGAEVTLSAGFVPGLDLGPDPVVRIGGGCVIGRGSHIVGHQSIEIGDHVNAGPYVYITDQNHAYEAADVPIGKQWPTNAPVSIGAGCWLGAHTVVLPGTRLGRNVAVAAQSVVRGEFPDHCMIAGVPARLVRRLDPATGDWCRSVDEAAEPLARLVDLDGRSAPSED